MYLNILITLIVAATQENKNSDSIQNQQLSRINLEKSLRRINARKWWSNNINGII